MASQRGLAASIIVTIKQAGDFGVMVRISLDSVFDGAVPFYGISWSLAIKLWIALARKIDGSNGASYSIARCQNGFIPQRHIPSSVRPGKTDWAMNNTGFRNWKKGRTKRSKQS
ncbi:hypothetical protein OAF34_05180 [Pirellulaceae bacterium]|nr:hypothetical protein [Pirellulaceae bacterium]